MADSMAESRKETLGAMFNLSAVEPNISGEAFGIDPPPPLPQMQTRPDLQNVLARAPPPLKRMSTSNSAEPMNSSDNEDEDEEPPESASLFLNSNKKSTIDSVVGKLMATKQTNDCLLDFSNSAASSSSDASVTDGDSSLVTPPPLRKCVPSPDPSKSRRKQSAPQATNDRVTESPPPDESAQTVQVPDIDQLLTDCAVVTPVEVPNLEIDSEDDDEEFRPMRVSSKGRVVKKPSWADVYTDHTTTETEEDGCMDWTPERPTKVVRSNADSFKPRAPPVILTSSASKHNISHEDLHSSMVMENTPSALILPFKHGWIRELVIRNPQNLELRNMDGKHTPADAYYYAPKEYGSVKLRSLIRVQDFLSDQSITNLSPRNFSFCKRSIYKPPEEFVRLAGKSTSRKVATARAIEKMGKSTKSPKAGSAASTPTKSPAGAADRKQALISPKTELPQFTTGPFKVVSTPSAILREQSTVPDGKMPIKSSPVKRSAPSGSRPLIKKIKADKDAVVRAKQFLITSTAPPLAVSTSSPKSTIKIIGPPGKPPSCLKKPQPCSDLCKGVSNKVPSVQCGVCLLLYHPECINWTTGGKDALFVCSICIMKSRIKPPDTKINLNGSVSTMASNKISSPLINQALNRKSAPSKENKGRLITIPYHVLEKIDTTSPFALKLNNETFRIDPTRLVKTASGVRILIKNDQVLQPSEVKTPTTLSPPPQKMYKSILDCYKQVSNPKTETKDIPYKPQTDLVKRSNSLPDNNVVVKQEVPSPDTEDIKPVVSSANGQAAEQMEISTTDSTEVNKSNTDQQSSELKDDQLIEELLDTLVEAVSTYSVEQHKYQLAMNEHKKKAAAAPTPVLQLSPNQVDPDALTNKLNNMNKPTDTRPSSVGCVGSMSEILYEQRASSGQTPKTYGKQSQQSAGDTALRSLIPKTAAATINANLVNVMTSQNGGMLVLPGNAKAVSTSAIPIGPVVLGSGVAPIASSVPIKPVTIRTVNTAAAHSSTFQHTNPGSQMKPIQVHMSGSNTKYVLVNPSATGSSLLAMSTGTTDNPLIVSTVAQAGNKPIMTLSAGHQRQPSRRLVLDPTADDKMVKRVLSVMDHKKVVRVATCVKASQTEHSGNIPEPKVLRCEHRHSNVDFSMTGSIYGCLLSVFKHLSVYDRLRAALVCRMWRAVSQHPSLNDYIDLERETSLSNSTLEHVTKLLSSQLTLLKLSRLACAPSADLLDKVVSASALSTLSIDCSIADGDSWLTEQLLAKFLALPKLRRLSIVGGVAGQTDLSSVSNLGTCPSLTHLSLKRFQLAHIAAVIELLTKHHPHSIRSVDCVVSANCDNPFEEKVDPGTLFTSIQKCTNLSSLSLQYPRLEVDSCEAEYLMDNYSTLLPNCDVSVQLYD